MSKAAVCRNFGVKQTMLIETLTRIGWPNAIRADDGPLWLASHHQLISAMQASDTVYPRLKTSFSLRETLSKKPGFPQYTQSIR